MSASPSLYVPENAPFNSEQRQWLNGLLANLFQDTPRTFESTSSLRLAVFHASQSGTAERLAKKFAKALKAEGHTATAQSVEHLTPVALAQEQHAIFFASTYGEGEPPDSARTFYNALMAEGAQRLDGVRYTVFCLGDRSYEQFCRFGIELDDRLLALGADCMHARLESDVDVDAPFEAWSKQVVSCLLAPSTSTVAVEEASAAPEIVPAHTRDTPFHAELTQKYLLTDAASSKQTIHFGFDLAEGDLSYEAGDACGVLAQNAPELVDELLAALPFNGQETVLLPKLGEVAVHDALRHHWQVARLTRKMVQAVAEQAQCNTLARLLQTDQAELLDSYLYGRGLIDLLHDYPGVVTDVAQLKEMLPRLTPRLYSISSSPAAHGRNLHCTIAVVRYQAHHRDRGGVASTMLSDRTAIGSRVPVYIQPNKRFRIPSDSSLPMIMIGPGTGVAPFRAFLHERRALGHAGRNWLFFGERSSETDFLYRDELQQFSGDGHLRLDTAFSRDQAHKIYVQDRMLEHGAELYQWLQDGASVYVCGDASRMAKDVDAALHRVVEEHGGLSAEMAQEYVSELNEQHRYHRDVY